MSKLSLRGVHAPLLARCLPSPCSPDGYSDWDLFGVELVRMAGVVGAERDGEERGRSVSQSVNGGFFLRTSLTHISKLAISSSSSTLELPCPLLRRGSLIVGAACVCVRPVRYPCNYSCDGVERMQASCGTTRRLHRIRHDMIERCFESYGNIIR